MLKKLNLNMCCFRRKGIRNDVVIHVILLFIKWKRVEELSSEGLLLISDNVNISHWVSHLALPLYSMEGQITLVELKSSYPKADV